MTCGPAVSGKVKPVWRESASLKHWNATLDPDICPMLGVDAVTTGVERFSTCPSRPMSLSLTENGCRSQLALECLLLISLPRP